MKYRNSIHFDVMFFENIIDTTNCLWQYMIYQIGNDKSN